jgi:hypothetical protein
MATALARVLKVGLKASIPVVGDVVASALEEGGGYLLDRHAAQKARAINKRMLQSMRNYADNLVKLKEASAEAIERVLPDVEEILQRHGLRESEWAAADFDETNATRTVCRRAADLLNKRDPDDRSLCGVLVGAYYSALRYDKDALLEAEPIFRTQVLSLVRNLPAEIERGQEETAEAALHLAIRAAISIPYRVWLRDRSPPGALLRADHGVVPFHGRDRELDELEKWCQEDAPISIRLYTGAGGIGKSRLLIELCHRLDARRWHAGFLANDLSDVPDRVWSAIATQFLPLLLVIDYAETRRKELVRLLRVLYQASEGPVRVVLLARAADDWWERLKIEGDGVGDLLSGPATRQISLGPLAMSIEERRNSYELAAKRFAEVLGQHTPSDLPADIEADYFRLVLLLHMMALAAIEGVEVKGDQGILDWMLDRERRFWLKQLYARSLPEYLVDAIEEAMAIVTLAGGALSKRAALNTMRKAGLLEDETQAVRNSLALLLHDTYPGTNWIEPILPDLLGEHLVQVALKRDPGKYLDVVLGPKDR